MTERRVYKNLLCCNVISLCLNVISAMCRFIIIAFKLIAMQFYVNGA